MDAEIKKTLTEQLALLAECSKNARVEMLPDLTNQMLNLARFLTKTPQITGLDFEDFTEKLVELFQNQPTIFQEKDK